MAMPALHPPAGEWTAELVRQLPHDGHRYEVIDGELLVSASPGGRHQRACVLLWRRIEEFVAQHHLGIAMCSPSDLEYSPRRMVQPDVYVVPLEGTKLARDWERVPRLMLVAEVLSPSTARHDRRTKRRMYLDEGVPNYWIVDPHARLVECWQPGADRPTIQEQGLTWHPAGHVPALVIDLDEYFEQVHAPFPDDLGW